MIAVDEITVDGETLAFLLVPPNYAEPVTIYYRYETAIDESVTGVEHRRASRVHPRLSIRYNALLKDADAQTLRQFLGNMDNTRVALPIWPDARLLADYGSRVHEGRLSLGWDDGLSNLSAAINAQASGTNVAPCMVGRLARPRLETLTQELCRAEIALREDGDWPLYINDSGPADWASGGWTPNWKGPLVEWTTDRLLYQNLGRGRKEQVQGTAAVRYSQKAKFLLKGDALRSFLAFWQASAGSRDAFDAPSWFQPGAATPLGPHDFNAASSTGRARFAGDLAVEYIRQDLAEVEVELVQVFDDADSGARANKAFCYRVKRGSVTQLLTEWETTLDTTLGDFIPARISHRQLKSSMTPTKDNARMSISLDDCPMLFKIAQGEHEEPVEIAIYECTIAPGAVPVPLFIGRMRQPEFHQNVFEAEFTWLGGLLTKQVPNLDMTITCNYGFLDAGCSQRRPAQMGLNDWQSTGTIHIDHGAANAVILRSVSHPSLPGGVTILPSADNYFQFGWFVAGSGVNKQSRAVIWSAWNGSDLILYLARPLIWADLTEGSTGKVVPGCNGAFSTCRNKFANHESFGGFPQMPSHILTAASGGPSGGK